MNPESDQYGDVMPLTQFDVTWASLNVNLPEDLKVEELKLWLQCRGAPIKGKNPI